MPTKVGFHFKDWDWMGADENKNGKNDVGFDAWVDKNRNGKQDPDEPSVGDFQLLQEMGCNSIRVLNTVPLPEAVFELTASAEALRNQQGDRQDSFRPERGEKTFAKILLQHPAVRSIHQALDATRKKAEASGEEAPPEEAPGQ